MFSMTTVFTLKKLKYYLNVEFMKLHSVISNGYLD